MKSLSRVRLFATPWTVAYQAPPSMGFSRQEYWSGLPFPSPGDLPDPGIKPGSPAFQADALKSEPLGKHIVYEILIPFFFQTPSQQRKKTSSAKSEPCSSTEKTSTEPVGIDVTGRFVTSGKVGQYKDSMSH